MLFERKIPAYLIDSENVGSTWVDLLQTDEKFDLYICVTENAKSLNFTLLKELTGDTRHKIKIIECQPIQQFSLEDVPVTLGILANCPLVYQFNPLII